MRELRIGKRSIADASPAWVIAEVGHNHGGNVQTACDMIQIAAACGCDAVKLQKRDNRTLYSEALLNQPYENEHSFGKTYGEHRQALEFSRTQYVICQTEAMRARVAFFATAFDEVSVDFLRDLHVPAIKIASGGLTDIPLLTHAAQTRIPIILSTGGGNYTEIDRAVSAITAVHDQLAILHCTASYPVRNYAELNLACIVTLRKLYPEFVIGWSGHDSGIAMSVMAYTLGARIIEKHFTTNRANKGTDHAFSLEPSGMTKLVRDLRRAHQAMGDGVKRYYQSEVGPIAKMRRRPVDGRMVITGERDAPTVN
jgi:sialic acid synthase